MPAICRAVSLIIAQNGNKRRRFKWSNQQPFFIRLHLSDGTYHFGKRLVPVAQVFPDIQCDNLFAHDLTETGSVFESVSNMENCFVAVTACARLGGI